MITASFKERNDGIIGNLLFKIAALIPIKLTIKAVVLNLKLLGISQSTIDKNKK